MAASESYLSGIESGRKDVVNPFSIIVSRFQEAQNRRLEEDKQRRAEELELKNALTKLGVEHDYNTRLEREKQVSQFQLEQEKSKNQMNTEVLKSGMERGGPETVQLLKKFGLIIDEPVSSGGTSQPSNASMSLISGGVGDAQGNPVVINNQSQSSVADLFMRPSLKGQKEQLVIDKLKSQTDPKVMAEINAQRIKNKQEQLLAEEKVTSQGVNNMIGSLFDQADKFIPAEVSAAKASRKGYSLDIQNSRIGRFFGAGESQQAQDAKSFDEFSDSTLASILKVLSNVGTLSDKDIEIARGFKPKKNDTVRERENKRENMRVFLNSKLKARSEVVGNSAGESNKSFNSVQEAEKAKLPKGTIIYVQGRKAIVE